MTKNVRTLSGKTLPDGITIDDILMPNGRERGLCTPDFLNRVDKRRNKNKLAKASRKRNRSK